MSITCTKLAWVRDPNVPQGQPALGTFTCPCGGVIGPVPFGGVAESLGMAAPRGPEVHSCPGCGNGYDGRGWLVTAEPLHDCMECGHPIFEGQRVRDYAGCVAHYACVPADECEGAPDTDDDMFGPADAVPTGTPEFEAALAASVAHLPQD